MKINYPHNPTQCTKCGGVLTREYFEEPEPSSFDYIPHCCVDKEPSVVHRGPIGTRWDGYYCPFCHEKITFVHN
jgi:hypothetical protein